MDNILLLDVSVGSLNKGDNIIMKCIEDELDFFCKDKFVLNLPTHVSAFHSYQVYRNSYRVQLYNNCTSKFVCGSNLLVKDLFTHFPQWNINLFNYKPLKGSILVGVGAGSGSKSNIYTKNLYRKLLNNNMYHSVRDERSKNFVEELGLKAINTGCPTMWKLTPEHCKDIPKRKSNSVVFTLTKCQKEDERDQVLIDTLVEKYNKVYYWVQGIDDLDYLNKFKNIEHIKIVNPSLAKYEEILEMDDLDYVGTRLHAGIYAMRYKKRSIIIAIDERAREINKSNNLNCIEKDQIHEIGNFIDSEFETNIKLPLTEINKWKNQFVKRIKEE
ncbi:MAG: polysaccharide pyruvyl transferase family protein [Romboutsia sp.]